MNKFKLFQRLFAIAAGLGLMNFSYLATIATLMVIAHHQSPMLPWFLPADMIITIALLSALNGLFSLLAGWAYYAHQAESALLSKQYQAEAEALIAKIEAETAQRNAELAALEAENDDLIAETEALIAETQAFLAEMQKLPIASTPS